MANHTLDFCMSIGELQLQDFDCALERVRAIGQGHTNYTNVPRNLHEHGCSAFLLIASYYVPTRRDPKDPGAYEETLCSNY